MTMIRTIPFFEKFRSDKFVYKMQPVKKTNRHNLDQMPGDCDVTQQSVCSFLSREELQLFDERKSCLFFKKGQHIFNEGSYPLGIYCIDTGKVKLEHQGEEGKMQIVRLAKAGDIIGYRALLCNEKYNASAVALEDVQACFIPKDAFLKVLESNNRLSLFFVGLLAADLRRAEETLTELAQKPVRERMAKALLSLLDTYGAEADGKTINITLSREELADIVGTATETTIRLLSEFRNEGLIELVGKRIRIINYSRLVDTAHGYAPTPRLQPWQTYSGTRSA
jgi:CRP-like cAMP-binding protein